MNTQLIIHGRRHLRMVAVLTGALAIWSTQSVMAETLKELKRPWADRQEHLDQIRKDLGLSDAQIEKIRALRDKHRQEMRTLREDSSLDWEAKADRIQEMRLRYRKEVDAILTPEQRVKRNEIFQRRMKFRAKRRE